MSTTKKGPYNIEITGEECVLLYYVLQLADNATGRLPYDSSTTMTDTGKIGLREAADYIDSIIGIADKMIEDAAGRDKNRFRELLESLSKKITEKMNT